MKKCLTIINRAAGGSKKISFEKVEKCLGDDYVYTRFSLPDDGDYSLDGFDAVAVCGGDGTLGSALNKAYDLPIAVFYFPSGTLNDKAKSQRYPHARTDCPACSDTFTRGKAIVLGKYISFSKKRDESAQDDTNLPLRDSRTTGESLWGGENSISRSRLKPDGDNDDIALPHASDASRARLKPYPNASESGIFSYVLATGSFTPIGYMAKVETKKKLGVFAYLIEVLKEYKIHRVNATIRCGSKEYSGQFTLIMFVKSPRCFGFKFNRAFDGESMSGHLVAIRSPKHRGALGAIEMFFPFFRVFFLGLKKEREGRIIFKKIYSARVTHDEATAYCRDGEKQILNAGEHLVTFVRSTCDFSVIDKY